MRPSLTTLQAVSLWHLYFTSVVQIVSLVYMLSMVCLSWVDVSSMRVGTRPFLFAVEYPVPRSWLVVDPQYILVKGVSELVINKLWESGEEYIK